MTFGQSIRQHRKRAGLTQAGLAGAAGLTATFVAMLERDEKSASLDSARRIARALGAGLDELLRRVPIAGRQA